MVLQAAKSVAGHFQDAVTVCLTLFRDTHRDFRTTSDAKNITVHLSARLQPRRLQFALFN
jgi:hypothetical protein